MKSQANTVVLELTANTPSTQVTPSTGSRTKEATSNVLKVYKIEALVRALAQHK